MSLQDLPDEPLSFKKAETHHPVQLRKDERYDTLIGVILAFAMAIGVWLYAVKPWQTDVLKQNTDAVLLKTPANVVAPAAELGMPVRKHTPVPNSTAASTKPEVIAEEKVVPTSEISPVPNSAAVVPTIPVVVTPVPTPEPRVEQAIIPTPLPVVETPVPEVIAEPITPVPTEVLMVVEPTAMPKVEAQVTPEPTVVAEPQVISTPEPQVALPANVVVRESIEFTTGSAIIPEEAKARLLEVALLLKDDPRQLKIVGHTDNVGFTGANHRLSLRRAKAIKRFLVAHGVKAKHLSVLGLGESQPIADNQTEEGRHRNRRIEIIE